MWDNQKRAQDLMQQKDRLENTITQFNTLCTDFDDTIGLMDLAEAENDAESISAMEHNLYNIASIIEKRKIECLFSGEADLNNAFLEIHAGAGGTESHDWALMLMRMYMRWAEKRKFRCEILDQLDGEEAGIKSITLKISGHNAYGWCRTESGVHRLVRISPFNAAGKRQTSFASVWVYPEIDDNIHIEINDKDLRIDTYRASGAGGQHINKTDSAVRITHLPTNIVVQCQSDRSQHKNRAAAFAMLRSRLYEQEMQKRQAATDAANANKTDNSWGHQIRSYVLQPYQMVKDIRSSYETSNTSAVLDGELDDMISATLSYLATNNRT